MEREPFYKRIFYEVVGGVVAYFIIAGLLVIIPQILAYAKVISFELATSFSIFVIGLAFIVYGLLKWYSAHQKRIDEMLNPYIFIKEEIVECEITKERGCVRKDTITIEALKNGVEEYRFSVRNTAAKGIRIYGLDGTKLTTTYDYKTDTGYKAEFNPLKKGDEHTITVGWKVEDLTHAPYLIRSYSNFKGFGQARITVMFPDYDIPETVYTHKYYSHTQKRIGQPIVIDLIKSNNHPDKAQAVWALGKGTPDKPDSQHSYKIEWEWKKK